MSSAAATEADSANAAGDVCIIETPYGIPHELAVRLAARVVLVNSGVDELRLGDLSAAAQTLGATFLGVVVTRQPERRLDAAEALLRERGRATGRRPHHLQRVFTRLVGLSPRKFGEALRVKRLKAGLKQGNGVADALYGAGYGSSSRLYEKAGPHLGMTPASYAKGGRGAEISFATAASPLGRLLVAATEKGVCMVALGGDDRELEKDLRREFPAAEIHGGGALESHLEAILGHLADPVSLPDLPLDVRATAFQWRVWAWL